MLRRVMQRLCRGCAEVVQRFCRGCAEVCRGCAEVLTPAPQTCSRRGVPRVMCPAPSQTSSRRGVPRVMCPAPSQTSSRRCCTSTTTGVMMNSLLSHKH
eukprot:3665346-Karenia_brevis.AAC.2